MTSNYTTGEQSGGAIKELKEDLGNKAREASHHLADKGREQADALSGKAADALEDVEAAAAAEADALEDLGWGNLSEYIRDMAEGIGGLSDNLRHKSVDELIRSASELARNNTGLFLLGSVAIGFGLSRFVKAAPRARDDDEPDWRSEANRNQAYGYQATGGTTSYTTTGDGTPSASDDDNQTFARH